LYCFQEREDVIAIFIEEVRLYVQAAAVSGVAVQRTDILAPSARQRAAEGRTRNSEPVSALTPHKGSS